MLLLAVVLSTVMLVGYYFLANESPFLELDAIPYTSIHLMLIALCYYLHTTISNQEKILCLLEKLP